MIMLGEFGSGSGTVAASVVRSGTVFNWLRFLLTSPVGVSTTYDLGVLAGDEILPRVGSLSVVIQTSVLSGRSGDSWTRYLPS